MKGEPKIIFEAHLLGSVWMIIFDKVFFWVVIFQTHDKNRRKMSQLLKGWLHI